MHKLIYNTDIQKKKEEKIDNMLLSSIVQSNTKSKKLYEGYNFS